MPRAKALTPSPGSSKCVSSLSRSAGDGAHLPWLRYSRPRARCGWARARAHESRVESTEARGRHARGNEPRSARLERAGPRGQQQRGIRRRSSSSAPVDVTVARRRRAYDAPVCPQFGDPSFRISHEPRPRSRSASPHRATRLARVFSGCCLGEIARGVARPPRHTISVHDAGGECRFGTFDLFLVAFATFLEGGHDLPRPLSHLFSMGSVDFVEAAACRADHEAHSVQTRSPTATPRSSYPR